MTTGDESRRSRAPSIIARSADCSFCGKSQEQVRRLIAGPGAVYICDECIALGREIIKESDVAPHDRKLNVVEPPVLICHDCRQPVDLRDWAGVRHIRVEGEARNEDYWFHKACWGDRLTPNG